MSYAPAPSPSPPGGPATDFFSRIGVQPPGWVLAVLVAVVALATLVGVLKPLAGALGFSVNLFGASAQRRSDRRREVGRRQLFADHIESQLRRIGEKEDWRDRRFTELEAHVEIEGEQRGFWPLRFLAQARSGPRRVRSLSKGLERSAERLILVQGEPGSGKSVAMRHLAHKLVAKAMKSRRVDVRIPLYLNLKEFRPATRPVRASDVREFVLDTLNRVNNRDVDDFLTQNFDRGMAEGSWLFLFDSFDEIPDVLSATDSSGVVEEYADALYDFLHAMNTSRGVVASREFRGPRRFGWPRFTVLRLSKGQQQDLVRRANLSHDQEVQLINGLLGGARAVMELADNPMLLGLLCSYVRTTGHFPAAAHEVFESFVNRRLEVDEQRLRRKYSLESRQLRTMAEEVAFCVASVEGLGLSPTRDKLEQAVEAAFGPRPHFARTLDALEFVKLASAPESGSGQAAEFTFAHRRFQEYFATCVALREPDRVSVRELLTDGKWRETAVTMLQSQRGPRVDDMLREAERLLTASRGRIPQEADPATGYEWPPDVLHVLNLLVAGLGDRPDGQLGEACTAHVGELLEAAYRWGFRNDQKWVVDVVVAAPAPVRESILEKASASSSFLLQEAAFEQSGRMYELPEAMATHIRNVLVARAARGQLRREHVATRVQLRRLRDPKPFLDAVNLLLIIPVFEFVAVAGASLLFVAAPQATGDLLGVAILALTATMFLLASRTFRLVASPVNRWTGNGFLATLAEWRFALVVLAALLGAYLFRLGDSHIGAFAAVCVGVYAGLWPVSALMAIQRGLSIGLARWPVIPVAVAPKVLVDVARLPPSVWKRLLGTAAVMATTGVLLAGGLRLLAKRFEGFDVVALRVGAGLLIAAIGISVVGGCVIGVRSIWRRAVDRRTLTALIDARRALDEPRSRSCSAR